jgi:hypothetical protein
VTRASLREYAAVQRERYRQATWAEKRQLLENGTWGPFSGGAHPPRWSSSSRRLPGALVPCAAAALWFRRADQGILWGEHAQRSLRSTDT